MTVTPDAATGDINQSVAQNGAAVSDSARSMADSAAARIEHMGLPQDKRVRISAGAAGLLVLAGSLATAIFVRRRAEARAHRLVWLAMRAGGSAALPGARRMAPIGGAGGSLLIATMLAARMRRAEARHRADEVNRRLDTVASAARSRTDDPHPRDVLVGLALGLGIAGALSRARRSS